MYFPDRLTPGTETPIRSELFGMERLEQHARSLAEAQPAGPVTEARPSLPKRLKNNYAALIGYFRLLAEAAKDGKSITGAGEWFLDNFHIVEEQIRQSQRDLPPSFYHELPKLSDGPLKGYPRVYGIAWALIAHSDSGLDVEKLERFIRAYQDVTPLTIGELWASAITLRITLVENLRRLVQTVVARVEESDRAHALARQYLARLAAGGAPDESILADASPGLLARVEQQLRNHGEGTEALTRSIEQRLALRGQSTETIIQEEYHAQAADDVSVRNVITAMRLVSDIDWSDFFERVSLVDGVLAEAPGYLQMDFASRDRYRRAVELLARRAALDEIGVARAALAAARKADAGDARRADPGYYLVDRGRRDFEKAIGFRPNPRRRLWRALAAGGLGAFVGAIALVTGLIDAGIVGVEAAAGIDLGTALLLALLALLPASDLAIALINRAVTRRRQPQTLPALALKNGVPAELSSLLVVPVLLGSQDEIARQVEQLEVHYLSNADAGLRFVLLSDWTDSDEERGANDNALLADAKAAIAELNHRYADGGAPIFLLLHRRRQFNSAQGKWMGWERKRGKLHELNRLLRGATDTSFLDEDGMLAQVPRNIRYVITLDADTRLPRGAARRLIGKMAHPLNRPAFDPKSGRVIQGHGIMQPRVTPSLPLGAESSLFQWAFSGPNGLDPYAFAVSDVYQDLFAEGSFVGKGIYDVDAFETAMDDRIAENTILSHDLLEGVFARAALVSDIEVVEEFPSRYDVEVSRQHRWMRGDWQLLPWIVGLRPGLSPLGRWKLIDNLRRSLGAPALLLAFLVGWTLPVPAAGVWTLFLVLVVALPPLMPVFAGLFNKPQGLSKRGYMRNFLRDGVLGVMQVLFTFTFMARLAFLALDAVTRTLWRLAVSHRKMLEWVTYAHTVYARKGDVRLLILQLAGALALVTGVVTLTAMRAPANLPLAMPFLALWAFSPMIARWASQSPRVEPHLEMSDDDRVALRLAARRTWSFFERFVDGADNHLPPDNFQEDPAPLIAHRTSPTNIGIYLNSALAARDFGWIGATETVERLEKTLATMAGLERYRGHFLNWYDTASLAPLEPRYVSTVDSGNLAGNLLVVKNACAEIAARPHTGAWKDGVRDTLSLLQAALQGVIAAGTRDWEDAITRIQTCLAASDCDRASLGDLAGLAEKIVEAVDRAPAAIVAAATALQRCIQSHLADGDAEALVPRLRTIAQTCATWVEEMEFGFLFDKTRQLLSIGFRIDEQALDANAYDLLASEARLASFLAIAKGDVPTRHWFRLARTLTPLGRMAALQSWSGSMFEYLMPALIMHEPPGSLLALSNRAAVRQQMRYAARRGVPWGISESQYYARDRDQNYQYSGFGVPTLGIKRGLAENLVVAPYATGLAAMIAPVRARQNLDRLTALGAQGAYGWYEAIDYTAQRLPPGTAHMVIRAYMAHHQGMMMVGIADVIHDGAMRERFHAEPMVKAAELLLQERMPRDAPLAEMPPSLNTGAITYHDATPHGPRLIANPCGVLPRSHLLSNGNYAVMLTAAGGGYSRWKDLGLTRWREDPVRDPWGMFFTLRDVRSGMVWSAGYNPIGRKADSYDAAFAEDRAEIKRTDGSLVTLMEVCISPEDDAEVRRISITNNGTRAREIDVTSYMELALAKPGDDAAHPAFSKLFVQTEFLRDSGALIATRRPRTPGETPVWAAHLSVVDGAAAGDVQYETDRGKFLGRGRIIRDAAAVFEDWPLSNSAGSVLDPIFAIRRRVQVGRGETVTVAFWTMAAATREDVLHLIDRHHDAPAFARASTLAATHAQSQLEYLGLKGEEPHLFQLLANYLLYANAAMRAGPDILAGAAPAAAALWRFGISGDLPILVLRVTEEDDLGLVRRLARAHDYWRSKGLAVDLAILNERAASYAQDLQQALDGIANERTLDAASGRIVTIRADLAGPDAVRALRAAARVDLSAKRGDLEDQLGALMAADTPFRAPRRPASPPAPASPAPQMPPLDFFNGYGGFSKDGREYVIVHRPGHPTPAPWINVIANPQFGFQVSAEGAGFTWALNSQQNQITPWSNDPVSNEGAEAIYLKDLDSGAVWSPTPWPTPEGTYLCRHGQGYSRFETANREIASALTLFAAPQDPVKIMRLSLRNTGTKPRRLAVIQYAEWALGASRTAAAPYIATEIDSDTGALFARNPTSADFGARVAFLDMSGRQDSWTGDRRAFIGRNGDLAGPAALGEAKLSGETGTGMDPCGALQAEMALLPGASVDLTLLLGQGASREDAQALVAKYRAADAEALLGDVTAFWDDLLGGVQIETPDAAMDVITNRWLLYQTLSCRMWARAGFYQVSGAYGFRDQLQDSMAMCVARPDLARDQLLRAAGRQFPEGDVQHWWLPESGKGIRTHISDDKSWLAYVCAHYIETTGDMAVLDEKLAFLTGPAIPAGQHDAFFEPGVSDDKSTLYEHVARGLDASLNVGVHGLPLMGTGDWNDGMNRVGEHGLGESVWLGWFLHGSLTRFMKYAEARGDGARAARWLVHMDALHDALEKDGWDGAWYRRAYFDDGFPLGSAANRECRIDSIAQSWAVISGVAAPDRQQRAMEAVEKYLVRPDDRLMALFSPPFVASIHDPGYIKGYPAGIRENGGQYTHGVLWTVVAFAMMGEGDKAGELFAMLNPVNHGRSRNTAQRYRVEPYVACGDVYSVPPHAGRGGWTWYSGSAAWMYRVALEYILGIRLKGNSLSIAPVIPTHWPKFEVTLRHRGGTYQITVENPASVCHGIASATLDDTAVDAGAVPLDPAGGSHRIHVVMGKKEH